MPRIPLALSTRARAGFKLKPLKTNENCQGPPGSPQIGALRAKEITLAGKGTEKRAHLQESRFTVFRTRVFHVAAFQLTFHASPEE